jgi:RHS repeat-associated protein
VGGRTAGQGYVGDSNAFKFAKLRRDDETGLDYAQHRYYSSAQGRFTSPDEPFADQSEGDPQSWNLYTYAHNNPLMYTDPSGLWAETDCSSGKGKCWVSDRKDDTYASLAKILGVNASTLGNFFSNQSISMGQVFDTSGYGRWAIDQFVERSAHEDPPFIPAAGGLNVVGRSGGGGLLSRIGSAIGRLFGRGAAAEAQGALNGSLNGLTQAERSMVQELLAQGKSVQIIPRATGKTADFLINGVNTELKTLTAAGPNTLKNAVETASKQGQQILIDARNVPINPQEALQQIQRAQGNIGGLQGRITVLTSSGTITY